MTQAYREWRSAPSQQQLIISSRKLTLLILIVKTIAHLARYERTVADLLLRYLGHLVYRDQACSKARQEMLQSLSQLEAKNPPEIAKASYSYSQQALRNRYLLDFEAILVMALSYKI